MSTKVRILSSDTPRLKLLEQRAEQGRQEVLELRNKVQELSTQIWNQYQRMYETNADSICLELGIEKLKSVIVDETAMKINLRTQILASLGCDLADEGCIEAITTSESTRFWSFLERSRSSNAELTKEPSVPSVPRKSVWLQGELPEGTESSASPKSPPCIQKEINDEEFNALPDTINRSQEDKELRHADTTEIPFLPARRIGRGRANDAVGHTMYGASEDRRKLVGRVNLPTVHSFMRSSVQNEVIFAM
ncbi:uncharacterized protein C8R40DRAFT_1168111 [Lentinula edodes]|uniref:uncharacterized protein n=1 Tax=Lentinula edodes TaxID=5353 RepID=UPI001E8E1B45|nr:uncharacterized protein C8R40DRAFT_1168111 [Lentinula edodes]KAH7878066.1 hypothetical protein C8R40DRAFT_1168111 [Lentinula edodes]